MSDKIVKRGRGRPAGTGYGKDIISKLHRGFDGALAELDARGKSLDVLLAEALERDVAGKHGRWSQRQSRCLGK